MNWLFPLLGVCWAAMAGWLARQMWGPVASSEFGAGYKLAAAVNPLTESDAKLLNQSFYEIRSDMTRQFDLLSSALEQLQVEGAHPIDKQLIHQTRKLTRKLASTYDDIRRFGDRLPTAVDSRVDPVTGVGNQSAFEEWFQVHFAYLSRYGNEFSIALLEIDEFDQLLDTDAEDAVAKQLADLMTENVRDTDCVFRYSGGTFVVTMPETPLAGSLVFAARILNAAEEGLAINIFGGTTGARHDDTLCALMKRARMALTESKADPVNAVFFHDGERVDSAALVPE